MSLNSAPWDVKKNCFLKNNQKPSNVVAPWDIKGKKNKPGELDMSFDQYFQQNVSRTLTLMRLRSNHFEIPMTKFIFKIPLKKNSRGEFAPESWVDMSEDEEIQLKNSGGNLPPGYLFYKLSNNDHFYEYIDNWDKKGKQLQGFLWCYEDQPMYLSEIHEIITGTSFNFNRVDSVYETYLKHPCWVVIGVTDVNAAKYYVDKNCVENAKYCRVLKEKYGFNRPFHDHPSIFNDYRNENGNFNRLNQDWDYNTVFDPIDFIDVWSDDDGDGDGDGDGGGKYIIKNEK